PFELALKIPRDKLPHIYLDCGFEDNLYKSNAELAKLLLDNKITHTFGQSPGKHDGAYWRREVRHSMAVQYAVIQENLARSTKAAENTASNTQADSAKNAKTPTAEKRGVLLNDSRALPGYNLINPSGKKTYLFDNEGRVVHSWISEHSGGEAAYLL